MTEKFQYKGNIQVIFVIDEVPCKPIELPVLHQSTVYFTDVNSFAMGHIYGVDNKPREYEFTVTVKRHKTSEEQRDDGTKLRERGF